MLARFCIQCQCAKVHKHTVTPQSKFPVPDDRFAVVHIDLVGPLPPSKGFTYILTCIDRFTRWPEAIPLTSSSTEEIAQALLNGWIQFESNLWKSLMSLLGTKRARTTAYHPQSNGMIERFHRQLKTALKAQHNSTQWIDLLPLVLLGIRSAVKQDLSTSTAELQQNVLNPAEYVTQLKTHMQTIRAKSPRLPNRKSSIDGALLTCTLDAWTSYGRTHQ